MIRVGRHLDSFQPSIDDWVSSAFQNECQDFRTLVHSLPGVFPMDAIKSVFRLERSRVISRDLAQNAVETAKRRAFHVATQNISCLPVPHPLDFDWRFDSQAISYLSKICRALSGFVICLGTPSLFEHFRGNSKMRSIFIDCNPAAIKHFGVSRFGDVVKCDCLRDPVPSVVGNLVVMDPPWYEQHTMAFLWVAAQICNTNGKVLISVPPLGTREDVASERIRLIDFARQLGLVIESMREGVLPYETPHFEHNTLHQLGIHCPLGAWRRGTLLTFQKLLNLRVDRPMAMEAEKWNEISIFGTRFRFRSADGSGSGSPILTSLIRGNVLKSVSRKNPIRPLVDVWTSGNRVFRCDAPNELFEIGMALANNVEASPIKRDRMQSSLRHKVAAEQLMRVATKEMEERRSLSGVSGVQFS